MLGDHIGNRLLDQFFGVAHVDQQIARFRVERLRIDLEISGTRLQFDRSVVIALRASLGFELALFEREQVDQHEFVLDLAGQVQQQLQCLQRLQRAQDAGDRTQHTCFCTVSDDTIASGFGPQTAQTSAVEIRAIGLQLTLVLIHAREDGRALRLHGCVVHEELGREIVAALDDEIIAFQQRHGVRGSDAIVLGNAHVRIQRMQPLGREVCF